MDEAVPIGEGFGVPAILTTAFGTRCEVGGGAPQRPVGGVESGETPVWGRKEAGERWRTGGRSSASDVGARLVGRLGSFTREYRSPMTVPNPPSPLLPSLACFCRRHGKGERKGAGGSCSTVETGAANVSSSLLLDPSKRRRCDAPRPPCVCVALERASRTEANDGGCSDGQPGRGSGGRGGKDAEGPRLVAGGTKKGEKRVDRGTRRARARNLRRLTANAQARASGCRRARRKERGVDDRKGEEGRRGDPRRRRGREGLSGAVSQTGEDEAKMGEAKKQYTGSAHACARRALKRRPALARSCARERRRGATRSLGAPRRKGMRPSEKEARVGKRAGRSTGERPKRRA